jgi:hypothetical protein
VSKKTKEMMESGVVTVDQDGNDDTSGSAMSRKTSNPVPFRGWMAAVLFLKHGFAREDAIKVLPLLKTGDYDASDKKKHSRASHRKREAEEKKHGRVVRHAHDDVVVLGGDTVGVDQQILASILGATLDSNGNSRWDARNNQLQNDLQSLYHAQESCRWRIQNAVNGGYDSAVYWKKLDDLELQEEQKRNEIAQHSQAQPTAMNQQLQIAANLVNKVQQKLPFKADGDVPFAVGDASDSVVSSYQSPPSAATAPPPARLKDDDDDSLDTAAVLEECRINLLGGK